MKPVLYLDVDDVLLMFPAHQPESWWLKHKEGAPAPGVPEFLTWAATHCEVRWLTSWAGAGQLLPDKAEKLAGLLGVDEALLRSFDNPQGWVWSPDGKPAGINWREHRDGREWAWVEDALPEREVFILQQHGASDRYYHTDTSASEGALLDTWVKLAERWQLPHPGPLVSVPAP